MPRAESVFATVIQVKRRLVGDVARRFSRCLTAALFLAATPASAINIVFHYDEEERPSFDPDGIELRRLADAAAQLWESYIIDGRTYNIDLSWGDLPDDTHGRRVGYPFPIQSTIKFNANTPDWFFDPTPFQSEEFELETRTTLVRDMTPEAIDAAFEGTPPLLLEVGFQHFASGGSPAAGKLDLFTVILHELGHELGYNNTINDDDYDLDPADIGGASLGMMEFKDYELNIATALQSDEVQSPRGKRTLPSAADILGTWDESDHINFNVPRVDFLGASGVSWNQTLNWIGGAIPDSDNSVFVRNGGLAQVGSASTAKSLAVNESSTLLIASGSRLRVFGDVQTGTVKAIGVAASQGRILIGETTALGSPELEGETIRISNGSIELMQQGSVLDANFDINIVKDGALLGIGSVEVSGRLKNDGLISAGRLTPGGQLVLVANGSNRIDLDGGAEAVGGGIPENPMGRVHVNQANLLVSGALADEFDGTATIEASRTMTIQSAWTMRGTLNLRGATTDAAPATVAGGPVSIGNGLLGSNPRSRLIVDGWGAVTSSTTTFTSRSTVELDIRGFAAGSGYDVLQLGSATRGGVLQLTFDPNFIPASGSFELVRGTSLTGQFQVQLVKPDGVYIDSVVLQTSTAVTLVVQSAGMDGDFNNDGTVDGQDLNVWKGNFGLTGLAARFLGDANLDFAVDGADFLIWQRNFGRTIVRQVPNGSIATTVPECSAVVSTLIGSLGMAICRRSRSGGC
jgi:hypothetical protein